MSRSVITDEDKNSIIMMYNSGMSITALSEKFGYKRSTVGELIRRLTKKGIVNTANRLGIIKKPKKKQKWKPRPKKPKGSTVISPRNLERYTEIANRYFKGEKVTEICQAYNLSRSQVYRIINAVHPEKKPHFSRSELTDKIIADLQEGTLNQNAIAKKYNVSRQLVSRAKQIHIQNKDWAKRKPKPKDNKLHFDVDDDIWI